MRYSVISIVASGSISSRPIASMMSRPGIAARWTVGTAWRSVFVDVPLRPSFDRTIPMPPASLTTWLFCTLAFVPRMHTMILPVTIAGSSESGRHSCASPSETPSAAASLAKTAGAGPAPVEMLVPVNVVPSSRIASARNSRSCVLAATVVTHG